MGENGCLSKGHILLVFLGVVIAALALGFEVWKYDLLGGEETLPIESSQLAEPNLESLEHREPSAESPEELKPKGPLPAIIEIALGPWHSRSSLGNAWKFDAMTGIKVDESGDDDGLFEVEVEIIGSEPCQVSLAPGQTGACGEYSVTLMDIRGKIATLRVGSV